MDPYRLFFPLGLVFGVLGTLLWVMFGFGWLSVYPGQAHSDFMIGGFLFSFASGFLMTAVPRFTGAFTARKWELALNATLLGSLFAFGLSGRSGLFHLSSFLAIAFLILFALRRFRRRSYDPPPFFVFVGVGLLSGMLGALFLGLSDFSLAGSWAAALGRVLYHHGMILSLVIGVGGQLLPAFFGWKDFSQVQMSRFHGGGPRASLSSPWAMAGLATILFCGFVLEGLVSAQAGRSVIAIVLTAVAFGPWKLHRRPASRGNLPYWLWLSAWSLLLGLWIPAVLPAYAVHGMHLAFVGGFGLMTLMIASRVTLAHGGYGMALERNSKAIAAAGALVLIAALTRVTAVAMPDSYLHHLAYAAGTWIVALAVWSGVFVPRMLGAPHSAKEDQC